MQLWRALDGIRNHYPSGSRCRCAIEKWMEVDDFEPDEQSTEAERAEAVAAWHTLEEMVQDFPGEHPVVKAMDAWLSGQEMQDGV